MATVCWQNARLWQVICSEAERMSEESFLATYNPPTIMRAEKLTGNRLGSSITQEQLLTEFLNPHKPYVNTVILGNTGSGKSHLVRWLGARIPESESRVIKTIPSSGVNLKKVIEILIRDVHGEEFDEYRRLLESATSNVSIELAMERMLDYIAEFVGEHSSFADERLDSREAQDDRDLLKNGLPAFLRDESVRRQLLSRQDSVIRKLVGHVMDDAGRSDVSGAFSVDDLAVDTWDSVSKQDLMKDARDIYQLMKISEGFRQTAVTWINRNLGKAFAGLLQFNNVDLSKMILDMRASFAEQNRELVILIEDFVKLEGIQDQLLLAFTQTADPDGRDLCRFRLAMAVTTSPYQRWYDTYRDRMDIVVTMDNGLLQYNADPSASQRHLVSFAARYLNAVRLSSEAIQEWHENAKIEPSLPVPNACELCAQHDTCTRTFGEASGVSLYPFNRTALNKLYTRSSQQQADSFIPRRMVNSVLLPILGTYCEDLAQDEFPSRSLLDHFGGSDMPAGVRHQLRASASFNTADEHRCEALLEYWGDPRNLRSVQDGIWHAFGLTSPLADTQDESDNGPDTADNPGPESEPVPESGTSVQTALPARINRFLENIDNWANNRERLGQELTNELRNIVFQGVDSYTDWDNKMLSRTCFVGQSRSFQPISINFVDQATREALSSVKLVFPLDGPDRNRTALALRAALLFSHHGHWGFEGGSRALRNWVRLLELASEEVLRQLRDPSPAPREWDPIVACVEVLAIGSVMGGTYREGSLAEIFRNPPAFESDFRSKTWNGLLTRFGGSGSESQWDKVFDHLLARIACIKGRTHTGAQMIDSTLVRSHLRRIHRNWVLSVACPSIVKQDQKPLHKLYRDIEAFWDMAVSDEFTLFRELHGKINALMPDIDTGRELVEKLRHLAVQFDRQYPGTGTATERLTQAVDGFESAATRNMLPSLAVLPAGDDRRAIIQYVAPTSRARARVRVNTFLDEAQAFLITVRNRATNDIQRLSVESGGVEELAAEIRQELTSIITMTSETRGVEPMPSIVPEAAVSNDEVIDQSPEPTDASGSLLEQCEEVLATLDMAATLSSRSKTIEALEGRKEKLQGYRINLEPAYTAIAALREAGILVDVDSASALSYSLHSTLCEVLREFSQDHTTWRSENWRNLARDLPIFAAKVDEIAMDAWQAYTEKNRPVANRDLLTVLVQIAEFKEQAKEAINGLQALDIVASGLPHSKEDIDAYNTARTAACNSWQQLGMDELDQGVVAFLQGCSSQGVRLDHVTAEVIQWVEARHLGSSFKVVINNDD